MHRKFNFRKSVVSFAIISLALGSSFVRAQENNLTNISKFSINTSSISFDYQTPIAEELVIDSKLGVGAGARIDDNKMTLDYLKPALFISSEIHYLYNHNKRKHLGKNTLLNSSPYIGFKTNYHFKSFEKKNDDYYGNTLSFAGVWGIQKSLNKSLLFNLHLGAGWINDFNTNNSSFYPEFGVGLSLAL